MYLCLLLVRGSVEIGTALEEEAARLQDEGKSVIAASSNGKLLEMIDNADE